VLSTVAGRFVCGIILVNGRALLDRITIGMDRRFKGREDEQLFFVMVMCPLVMNALQAYVQVGASCAARVAAAQQCWWRLVFSAGVAAGRNGMLPAAFALLPSAPTDALLAPPPAPAPQDHVLKGRQAHASPIGNSSSSQPGTAPSAQPEAALDAATTGKGDAGKPGDKGRPVVVVMDAA
jgi:hypothetical protein